MSSIRDKRKQPSSHTGGIPYAKRSRPSYAEDDDEDEMAPTVTPYERPRNHPIYGQKSAFPGLDTAGDDELFYGPAEDGLEYLRMVRSEANSLPFLFTAPQPTDPPVEETKQSETEQDLNEPQPEEEKKKTDIAQEGFYADGVYVAAPLTTSKTQPDTTEPAQSDAQSSYYNLLHHRFLLLRSILKCTPPSTAIAALDESHPISLPRRSRDARKEWRRLLLAVDPQTVQLACMDMDSVLGVLEVMAKLMSENIRSGDAERVRRIGAWAWGLLGKCRDVGQLASEEVGEIRDLGKRAAKILRKMREEDEKKRSAEADGNVSSGESDDENPADDQPRVEEETKENAEAPSDPAGEALDHDMPDAEQEPPAEELEMAKARLQAKIEQGDGSKSTEPEAQEDESKTEVNAVEVVMQTRAMLDMIITVNKTKTDNVPQSRNHNPNNQSLPNIPPYTVYNLTLRLPLRSFTISKRYSDFLNFHKTLLTQTNIPPPAPLPQKTWFKNTVSNASLREDRRQALEAYLQAINDADDPRWRNSPAWRAFLNLPSAANASHTSTRLHAAITDPGSGADNPISDPTLWLDVYRDMKSHLHDARLHLTRRDQETTPQKQHESSARAKSSLVRAGSLVAALEEGLKVMGEAANRAQSPSGKGRGGSLGDGELRRRKDLLINARKEKDGLEDLLNAMAAKSRVDHAVASVQDKEALVGSASRKPARSGRVLGKETERTRELDNQGLLQLQRQTMEDQDQSVEELLKIIRRQKELGIAINEEVEIQNALLSIANEDAERVHRKIDIGKKRIGKIS
ncbi:Phox-like domain-containing protein [Aspergillus oryzae]|uniref:Phox-like domain-containing protein n=1 Tax=Aspergillus oryzae TaxID=5062 RepID=A0A1S9E0G2_ASPOZ|nr:Phox-like domain-containing protein [Aspergillus oryzae]